MKTHLTPVLKTIIPNLSIFVNGFPAAIRKQLPEEISVISASSEKSQKLNSLYRKKAKPTNVLSFLYSPEYGEIIVCPAVIRAEAKAAGSTFHAQMTWMIVHGMLHLAGKHHEASAKAEAEFERIEQEVLWKYKEYKT